MTFAMQIHELSTDAEFAAIYPLIRLLNKDMTEDVFAARLKTMRADGYRCIAAMEMSEMLGISGFWTGTQFWCGKFLEIDNLVVVETARGKSVGTALMQWLESEAKRLGCDLIDMPVYTHNHGAQRFYIKQGYVIEGFYFTKRLKN